jgi:hypothetical protein
MPELKEDLLQFAWRHKLLKPGPLITAGGRSVTVIKPGDLNRDSGPDFFNARIRLGELILAGNIEIHIKTGDWLKHHHQNDRSYDNIILHVVYEHDTDIPQNIQNNVEVLEIKNLLPEGLIEEYNAIFSAPQSLACYNQLPGVNDLKFSAWLQRMFVERMEQKVKYIEDLFENYGHDYLQTFYTVLLRNFGFKVNALPFELLAKQLPVTILLKHADSLLHLEALLLGTSGLLEEQFSDKYILALQNEFEYLKRKYRLSPLKKELFKFSKLRPANFATVRLAQFAAIVHRNPQLLSAPQNYNSYGKIRDCLTVTPGNYWQHHYHPDGNATKKNLQLGSASAGILITNTFANFFFFYFKRTGHPEFAEIPLQLMEKCAFEKNTKTKLFDQKKDSLKSAADSQALIHLHDNYCRQRRCLDCGIATAILSGT